MREPDEKELIEIGKWAFQYRETIVSGLWSYCGQHPEYWEERQALTKMPSELQRFLREEKKFESI